MQTEVNNCLQFISFTLFSRPGLRGPCSVQSVSVNQLWSFTNKQQELRINMDPVTLNLFVMFEVNSVELRFFPLQASDTRRALPGMEELEQRWKLLPSLSVILRLQKLAAILWIDWFHNRDAEQSCIARLILRIPGFSAHTQRWSHRGAHEQDGEKGGGLGTFLHKTGPVHCAAGNRRHDDSF